MNLRERAFELLDNDPLLAHAVFFGDRHQNADAPFHAEMIRDWHSDIPNVLTMAFRGSAKSTKAEEAITLEVCHRRSGTSLYWRESETRAAERLDRHQASLRVFTRISRRRSTSARATRGQETRACTSTGVMIQAYGRGQSLRGVKHLDERPDFIFLDDVEDKESGSCRHT